MTDKKLDFGWINMLKKNQTKKNVQSYVGKKSYLKKLLCWKKNLTKQNVQSVLAVGPRKNSKNQ